MGVEGPGVESEWYWDKQQHTLTKCSVGSEQQDCKMFAELATNYTKHTNNTNH